MRRILGPALLAVALLGCGMGDDGTGVSREAFIDVMVELRQAAEQTRRDPAAFEARREQILRDAGVTEEQLRAYVEAHGRDLEYMARVWETINERLIESAPEPAPM